MWMSCKKLVAIGFTKVNFKKTMKKEIQNFTVTEERTLVSVEDLYISIVKKLLELYKTDEVILVEKAALQILAHQVALDSVQNW